MKKTLLIFGLLSLFLHSGTAKVTPAETVNEPQHLAIDARPDVRPHSAPDHGSGLTRKTSLACLQFVAEEQRKRANTVATTGSAKLRPTSADSHSGSGSPGSFHLHIKGLPKDRPFKFMVGGSGGSPVKGGQEDEKISTLGKLKKLGGALPEEDEDDDESESDEKGCAEKACGCFGNFLKLVGLAACL